MATVSGITIEQKVVTVPNTDTDINNEINTQSVDGWLVVLLILSGSDVIILFNRTSVAS